MQQKGKWAAIGREYDILLLLMDGSTLGPHSILRFNVCRSVLGD